MAYFVLFMAALFYSGQIIFSKNYQLKSGSGFVQSIWFLLLISVSTIPIFLPLNAGDLSFEKNAILYAAIFAFVVVFSTIAFISAYSIGKITVVTMYTLIGSAIIPFIYGILFLHEEINLIKILAVLLMCLSFFPSALFSKDNLGQKFSLKYILLCIVCFLTNGIASLMLKLNQLAKGGNINFIILSSLILIVTCSVILLFMKLKRRNEKLLSSAMFNRKSLFFGLGFSLFNGSAALLSMTAAAELGSSVQFPILSGSQLILSGFVGYLFFKEKITRAEILGIMLALFSIILFVI